MTDIVACTNLLYKCALNSKEAVALKRCMRDGYCGLYKSAL